MGHEDIPSTDEQQESKKVVGINLTIDGGGNIEHQEVYEDGSRGLRASTLIDFADKGRVNALKEQLARTHGFAPNEIDERIMLDFKAPRSE